MASFVNANLGSDSDSDDADFDPTKEGGEVVSEEENSGDDENPDVKSKKQTKKKKNTKNVGGGRTGGIFLEVEDDGTKAENESRRKEFEQEKEDIAKEVQKQKTDDLWAGKEHEFYGKRVNKVKIS